MWSPQQEAALRATSDWIKSGDKQVFRLFGFAGTGKTTLARHLAEGVDGHVQFGAYTGKASQVLRQKGCKGATTIHSLIYNPREKGQSRLKTFEAQLVEAINRGSKSDITRLEELIRLERTNLSRPSFALNPDAPIRDAKLVVIDECSMVDGQMGEDLLSFGKKVLVLGDPAQLPPIGSAGFFTEKVKPDVMLTEIHRQARDNPILHLATEVREGRNIDLGTYGDSRVITRSQLSPDDITGADQVLVGKNVTRRGSNRRMRELLGLADQSPFPVEGDKLICLRNNHELGLLNGSLWETGACCPGGDSDKVLLSVSAYGEEAAPSMDVEAWSNIFQGADLDIPWYERKDAEEFDYGYAITVHKSQGSQWDDVALLDEWRSNDRAKWLYTGITRAAEKITVVKM